MAAAVATRINLCSDADNTVHFLGGRNNDIVSTGLSPNNFFRHGFWDPPVSARIVGLSQNIELVDAAYIAMNSGILSSLEVCSPLIGRNSVERTEAPAVLRRMALPYDIPGSLGGWRKVGEHEKTAYSLATWVKKNWGKPRPRITSIGYCGMLQFHPAWPAVSFPYNLNFRAVVDVLGLIVDPRYYIDINHPTRATRLWTYLGLDAVTQSHVSGNTPKRSGTRYPDRCELVQSIWKRDDDTKPSSPWDAKNFLLQRWHHYGGGVRADMRVSQDLILFIRDVWLDSIDYQSGRSSEPLFDAKAFFTPRIAAVYDEHCRAIAAMH